MRPALSSPLSWLKYIVYTLLACFFLVFGFQVLLFAYDLNDPFSFIMTFFASNLIILISATLMLVFVIRIVNVFRKAEADDYQQATDPLKTDSDEEQV
jgi:hypothetical protein